MGERIVKIKLWADATGVVQGFAAARDAAAETKTKVMESARSQRAEWATVGAGLTAVGVAVTGIGVAAMKTGIEYNTLQQTTRAALTTLLGSAKAATEQMDKLDAFARNSPFSKQTFISAQQQMLAFGVETKKVIPYMDALQNAVAAAGGSNNDIAELAEIFGKVQSSAKITAIDLQQFGRRGVNAADLIGSQMGKTGAQIRSEITAGTLDATRALDALAAGMSEKYAGAAANVKQTFEGAMDRVKAAWRDFAAELAKPLVDPNGGGALVDLLNWTADAMRNFEKLPDPIKQTSAAVVGLGGAGALLLGTSMLLIPKWVQFTDALATFNVNGARARSTLMSLTPAALALALVPIAANLATWSDEMRGVTKNSNELAAAIKRTRDFSVDLERGLTGGNPLRGLGNDAVIVDNNLRALNTTAGDLKASLDNSVLGQALSVSLLGFGRELGNTKKQIEELDGALAQAASSGQSEAAARAYEDFAEMARNAGWSQEKITEALPQYAAAQAEASAGTGGAARQFQEAADKASSLQAQVMQLVDAMLELNGVGRTSVRTNAAMQESYASIQDYIEKARAGTDGYVLSLDASTLAGAKNQSMLAGHAANLEADAKAQLDSESRTIGATQAMANYESRLASGREQIYETALALSNNAAEAQKLTDKIMAMPNQKALNVLLQGAQEVENQLATLARRRETTIGVRYEGGTGTMTRAYGGTIGYASGGTIGGAAFGKTIGGLGGGVAGGTVFGAGGTKSDSVLVRLSRGEEVIQEPYASMYRKELKQMNRGDFVSQQQPQIVVISGGGSDRPANEFNFNGPFYGDPQHVAEQIDVKQRRAQVSHGVRDIR